MLLIALAIIGVGLWWNGMRAKELAVSHSRAACERENLQLLDQTVALTRMRISRNERGSACLRRHYRFEFTQLGTHRDSGTVSMNGHKLVGVTLPFTRDKDGNRVFLH